MSDSLGLVDFVIGLVNSVLNLPDGQVNFKDKSNNRRTVINPSCQNLEGGELIKTTFEPATACLKDKL